MAHAAALIAIVEDDTRVRTALARLLGWSDYTVLSFAGGDEFLGHHMEREPDCLVLDLHMPGLSGFEVMQRLTAGGRTIPTVVITGQDSPVARQRAQRHGACAYLCKPVDRDELTRAIENAIDGAQAGRPAAVANAVMRHNKGSSV
jgi:FixJ family two-component response regulator